MCKLVTGIIILVAVLLSILFGESTPECQVFLLAVGCILTSTGADEYAKEKRNNKSDDKK